MEQNNEPLLITKEFIEEMSEQFVSESGEEKKDAFIKAGLFVMFAWAHINKKVDTIDELKKEASRIFERTGNFFHQAVKDIQKIKVENPFYYESIKNLTDVQFDNLLDYIQTRIKVIQ